MWSDLRQLSESEKEYAFTAHVSDEDITSINVGDGVTLELHAYDDTGFEYSEGVVISMDDIPLNIFERGAPYAVKITPEMILKDIKLGMEGSIDIIVGIRTAMDYYLESLIKGVFNCLKEK